MSLRDSKIIYKYSIFKSKEKASFDSHIFK